jgi:spermidine synthase
MSLISSEWFTEAYEGKTAFSVRIEEKLFQARSDFQKIEVYKTQAMGRVLILDGCFMVTESDSFIYHEMLVHPAMSAVRTPSRVLVIGGGDGGAVTEIVKYPCVESVTLCEIDPMVISTCRKYFPEISSGLDDPRVTIATQDGADFVARRSSEFDLVLVDSTDPVGPGEALFRKSFFESVKNSLRKGGAAVFQTESPLFMENVFASAVSTLKGVFGKNSTYPYLATIPSYPGGLWSFTFCSTDIDPVKEAAYLSLNHVTPTLKYYNRDVQLAAFSLPVFARSLCKESS